MATKYDPKIQDEKIKKALTALSGEPPKKLVGAAELLSGHRTEIARLIGKGYSHQQVADALKNADVNVQPKTISQVIGKGAPPK